MINRVKAAWRALTKGEGQFEPELEREDGWTDWIHPQAPFYKLECCDCGLVHDMQFMIASADGIVPEGGFNEGESEDAVVWFCARRS